MQQALTMTEDLWWGRVILLEARLKYILSEDHLKAAPLEFTLEALLQVHTRSPLEGFAFLPVGVQRATLIF